VDIENGGIKLMRVRDNGGGIEKEDLPLALSRHATSKIDSVDDLLNLHSLGFRGEALASICSVSEWEMISRPHAQKQAVKISYLLPDGMLEINHSPGTRVSIKQLFCNTPARRKFLRAERTEYRHCEDVIKRMALARFDVAFYVKHNGRQTLRLPAVNDDIGRSRRVGQICGEAFIKQSMVIDYPYSDMRLWGWVSQADYSRQSTDLQYFYINGRIIRDRVINHAIRLAYQHVLPAGRHAAYVLHLEIDPASVDVNVHPTKYEVRFRESRIIHDFISRSIRNAIKVTSAGYGAESEHGTSHTLYTDTDYTSADLHQTNIAEQHVVYQQDVGNLFGQVLTMVHERFALTMQQQKVFLIDLQMAVAIWVSLFWLNEAEIKSLPLLIPQRLELGQHSLVEFEKNEEVFSSLGFDLSVTEDKKCLVRKIPSLLQYYDSEKLLQKLFALMVDSGLSKQTVSTALFDLIPNYKKLELKVIFEAIESSDEYTKCWRELNASDLSDWLSK